MTAAAGSLRFDDPHIVLRIVRMIVGALLVSVLGLALAVVWLAPLGSTRVLDLPAGVIGLIAPVLAYRLYQLQRERVAVGASVTERCAAFARASILAVAVTEGAAMVGLVAHLLGGAVAPLVGVATHVLLVGAIWPTPQRFALFHPDGTPDP